MDRRHQQRRLHQEGGKVYIGNDASARNNKNSNNRNNNRGVSAAHFNDVCFGRHEEMVYVSPPSSPVITSTSAAQGKQTCSLTLPGIGSDEETNRMMMMPYIQFCAETKRTQQTKRMPKAEVKEEEATSSDEKGATSMLPPGPVRPPTRRTAFSSYVDAINRASLIVQHDSPRVSVSSSQSNTEGAFHPICGSPNRSSFSSAPSSSSLPAASGPSSMPAPPFQARRGTGCKSRDKIESSRRSCGSATRRRRRYVSMKTTGKHSAVDDCMIYYARDEKNADIPQVLACDARPMQRGSVTTSVSSLTSSSSSEGYYKTSSDRYSNEQTSSRNGLTDSSSHRRSTSVLLSDGTKVPLIGVEETWRAIEDREELASVACSDCGIIMHGHIVSSYLICPRCRSLSPVDHRSKYGSGNKHVTRNAMESMEGRSISCDYDEGPYPACFPAGKATSGAAVGSAATTRASTSSSSSSSSPSSLSSQDYDQHAAARYRPSSAIPSKSCGPFSAGTPNCVGLGIILPLLGTGLCEI